MLKGIDQRLNAEVLHVLASMGHGDTLMLVDTNFPAETHASRSTYGSLVRMENLTLPEAVGAVLTLFPLDTFVADFAASMQVVGAPGEVPPVMAEVQRVVDRAEGTSRPIPAVERFAFYDLANEAFAIIRTGEGRFYGNVMLRKGVVPPTTGAVPDVPPVGL